MQAPEKLVRDGSKLTAKHVEGGLKNLLKGDPAGSARLAAADERINRALADAVERHATKDLGVRGMLMRASVVRHPESASQKRICVGHRAGPDTTPSCLSYGGIIGVRCMTQRHHKHRPRHGHERRSSSKQ